MIHIMIGNRGYVLFRVVRGGAQWVMMQYDDARVALRGRPVLTVSIRVGLEVHNNIHGKHSGLKSDCKGLKPYLMPFLKLGILVMWL